MDKTITLRRGLDLRIEGTVPAESTAKPCSTTEIALVPDDFPGFTPKLAVKEGDNVTAGQALMYDKLHEDVKLVSPIAGKVTHVVRGDRRKIMRVVVTAETTGAPAIKTDADTDNATDVKKAIMHSGLWAYMRQRPYDIVPDTEATPVNIFVTAFDSAPLAPSLTNLVKGKGKYTAAGLKALASLTSGKVYVSLPYGCGLELPAEVERVTVKGPHPAGNAGVQAAAIAPVNKGEIIWTLDIVTATRIGTMLLDGTTDWSTTVAVTGPEVNHPCLITTTIGASLKPLVDGNLKDTDRHLRIISGNVLTGAKESIDGFLRFPYRQITVIAEGDDVDEFMGWASMSPGKMSESRSFPSRLFHNKLFRPDARLNGGRRAMIMSGEYDKVMPMDILPEYLIKAILARDIDRMEALGIYEVAPEDFALCEYVDPSKLELQKIVREGLDYLRKELE